MERVTDGNAIFQAIERETDPQKIPPIIRISFGFKQMINLKMFFSFNIIMRKSLNFWE
jgi:hypothetical protein